MASNHLERLAPPERRVAKRLIAVVTRLRDVFGDNHATLTMLAEFSTLDTPLRNIVLDLYGQAIPGSKALQRRESRRPRGARIPSVARVKARRAK